MEPTDRCEVILRGVRICTLVKTHPPQVGDLLVLRGIRVQANVVTYSKTETLSVLVTRAIRGYQLLVPGVFQPFGPCVVYVESRQEEGVVLDEDGDRCK